MPVIKTIRSFSKILKKGFFSEGSYELQSSRKKGKLKLQKNKSYTIASWNLGYFNLGEESSWIFNGGKRFITATKDEVEKNISGIIKSNKKIDADFYLFQEITKRTVLTYYSNAHGRVFSALKKYSSYFAPKISIRSILIPLQSGNATMTHYETSNSSLEPLPDEKIFIFKKQLKHHMLICEHPVKGTLKKLYTINIHFPAYDPNAKMRNKHLKVIQEKVQAIYKEGHYVICGGDWNLLFTPKDTFKSKTKPERIRHVLPFPDFAPIKKWTWAYDSQIPTLRELDGPYKKGNNFVGIVDGFLISPNVKVKKTENQDYKFTFSDHNPVITEFQLT